MTKKKATAMSEPEIAAIEKELLSFIPSFTVNGIFHTVYDREYYHPDDHLLGRASIVSGGFPAYWERNLTFLLFVLEAEGI